MDLKKTKVENQSPGKAIIHFEKCIRILLIRINEHRK